MTAEMTELFQELRQRFPGEVDSVDAARPGETYVRTRSSGIKAVTDYLIRSYGARIAATFAEDRRGAEGVFYMYYAFEQPGSCEFLILQVPITNEAAAFPSMSAELPSLNWQEREVQDWFGLTADGHPNPRRVALHDNWPDVCPLRKDFPIDTVLPPFEGERHRYRPAVGEGVFHVPVGPVHAGIIEPGHFNFAVAGEPILYLQLRMFYTHKGTEKRFEHLKVPHAVFLAESISGDSSFSHAVAFCQAIERAGDLEVPLRGQIMRTLLLELERVYNHVADIGAIATDVGFVVASAHATRIREQLLNLNEVLTGNRLLRGMACIGGVRRPWDARQTEAVTDTMTDFQREFEGLVDLIESSDSTRDRLEHTGVLHPDKALSLGIVGVAGRASGRDLDVRRDHPYAAYSRYPIRVPVYDVGDVWHRMQVRIDEVRVSIELIRRAVEDRGDGPHRCSCDTIPADRCAISAVEGWRGEILHWVRTGSNDQIERCKIKDPSVNNWPAVVEAVQGNIIADFPVINKSFNLSYSGTDR